MDVYLFLFNQLTPSLLALGLLLSPKERDLAGIGVRHITCSLPIIDTSPVLSKNFTSWDQCIKRRRYLVHYVWLKRRLILLSSSRLFEFPHQSPVMEGQSQVPIQEKHIDVLLLSQSQQSAQADDDPTIPRKSRSRSISIHQYQQVNSLALRMQLPGHLIGYQPSIAPAS